MYQIFRNSSTYKIKKKTKLINMFFFSGVIGDWKNHFTVAINEHFDAVFKKEMKDSNIRIQFE